MILFGNRINGVSACIYTHIIYNTDDNGIALNNRLHKREKTQPIIVGGTHSTSKY